MFSLIAMILSFLLSKKAGMSNGKAALVAGAAGLATWTSIDPMNPDAIWKPFHKDDAGSVDPDAIKDADGSVYKPNLGGVVTSLGSNAADVAKSWGAAGTTGAVVGIGASGSIVNALKKAGPYILGGIGVYVLYKMLNKGETYG